jgi:hypothetical protein
MPQASVVEEFACQENLTKEKLLPASFVKKPLQKPFNHRNTPMQVGISMSKSSVFMLVLIFLVASCIAVTKPALSSVAIA